MSQPQPFFTIVMPSFLGKYKTAASNRNEKIHRAIESVLNQSFTDWELLIIADGCRKTFEIIKDRYFDNLQINCSLIPKQPEFGGGPRNKGIADALGRWIIYLDIDDYYGNDHLKTIHEQLQDDSLMWAWFNDKEWQKEGWTTRHCNINRKFQHGTSNVVHKKEVGPIWNTPGYLHDHHFINELKKFTPFKQLTDGQYYVCHIPGKYDI